MTNDKKEFIRAAAGSQVYTPRDADDFGGTEEIIVATIEPQSPPDVCRFQNLDDYNAAVARWNGHLGRNLPFGGGTMIPLGGELPPGYVKQMTPGQWVTQRGQCGTMFTMPIPQQGCPPGHQRVGGMCLPPLDPMRFRRGR